MNTATFKRKIIDIPEDTFRNLSIMAAAEGKNLKSFIESLLISQAKVISDEDIYQELLKTDLEGKMMASDEETREFEKWLDK
jgi:hypothetical protein